MTFAQRIARILELTKESRASLVKRTGISKTALNDFLAGRTDPSFKMTVALIKAFPDYNARGLLTGVKSKAVIDREKAKKTEPSPIVQEFLDQERKPFNRYKEAVIKVVSLNKSAIPFLLGRMLVGLIDGETGGREFCCLFGTLGMAQGIEWYKEVPGHQEDSWTAEAWFYEIKLGDTPSTSEFARLAYEWISEYQRSIT